MNTRVAAGLYVGLWAAASAAVIYVVTGAGISLWLAAVLAYLLFLFVNGSLAYVFRVRQLRREGKPPPSYLSYLFFPKGLRETLSVRNTVSVPRPIRVLLGLVISLGGAVLVVGGGFILNDPDFSRMPHPFVAIFMLVAMGVAFAYVGLRLIIVKNDEPLLRHRNDT